MPLWNLEKIYQSIEHKTILPDRFIVKKGLYHEKDNQRYSKRELAELISSQDSENLTAGSSSKDSRVQLKNKSYDRSKFEDLINNTPDNPSSNPDNKDTLKVKAILLPGEQGATSGSLKTYIVIDSRDNEYPVVLGKGLGFGTNKEDLAIEAIKEKIKEKIISNESGEDFIILRVNGVEFEVDGIRSITGTPKADAAFTRNSKNVVFVSLKNGKKASDFQQWGGITAPKIAEHEEVKEFMALLKDSLQDKYGDTTMERRDTYFMSIESDNLKLLSLYGKENEGSGVPFADREFGINNVHFIAQGYPNSFDFEEVSGNENTFTFKGIKIFYNGELPTEVGEGGYDPVLFARYTEQRSSFGVKNCRLGIISREGLRKAITQLASAEKSAKMIDTTDIDLTSALSEI